MKSENVKWYILIAAALLVGAIIGHFATANLATTGNAKSVIQATNINSTNLSKTTLSCWCNSGPGCRDTEFSGTIPGAQAYCVRCCGTAENINATEIK
jgi:hypothetical protein